MPIGLLKTTYLVYNFSVKTRCYVFKKVKILKNNYIVFNNETKAMKVFLLT